ncbi:MAG TPA: hypothetical protein PL069_12195, partial [Saprospiraceae bacterium]|nr:hypothetical protein [Saprospiraceae bacterium]
IFIGLNCLAALYFTYLSFTTMFVYFSNKSMGFQESFLEPGKNLILALLFIFFTAASWFLLKSPNYHKLGMIVFYIPIVIIGLYILWAVIMLIGSGGKWN